MKYTYRIDAQCLSKDSIYLVFNFDRTISDRNVYQSWDGSMQPTVQVRALLNGVGKVKGVIPGVAVLIRVSGNSLSVKVIGVVPSEIPNIADRIVKRVQRRFAKGETRQRLNREKVIAEIDALNVRLNGLAILNK